MRNYEPLSSFLGHLKGDYWRPTFHELERLLDFDLPGPARKSGNWWRNEAGKTNPQASVWLDAGWSTGDVNFEKQTVTFHRGPPAQVEPGEPRPLVARGMEAASMLPQERPLLVVGLSAAVAFGAGLVLGLLIGQED